MVQNILARYGYGYQSPAFGDGENVTTQNMLTGMRPQGPIANALSLDPNIRRDAVLPFESGTWRPAVPGFLADVINAADRVGSAPLLGAYNPAQRDEMIEGAGAVVGPMAGVGVGRAAMAPRGASELGSSGGKVAGHLPMDFDSRMARAEAMGFRLNPVYHGTATGPDGTIFNAFDPARTGGRTSGSRAGLEGVSVALNPEVANEFALLAAEKSGGNPAVMPLLHRTERPASVRLDGTEKNIEVAATLNDAFGGGGYDAVALRNYTTPSGKSGQTAVVLKNPNQLRSPNAAFDPARAHEADLLASDATRPQPINVFKADQPGIRAYHGSPHDFDRFSIDKVGTGEGAQAYGHGLYFAENEGVAKTYRDTLSSRIRRGAGSLDDATSALRDAVGAKGKVSTEVFDMPSGKRWQVFEETKSPGWISKGKRRTIGFIDELKNTMSDNVQYFPHSNEPGALDKLVNPGRLYDVNIKANPDDFLDWDKPLSQQSEKVRQALGIGDAKGTERASALSSELEAVYADLANATGVQEAALIKRAHALEDELAKLDPNGAAQWKIEANANGPEASRRLREAGIPGIKYLDQGSRGKGDGSRNYVVFDDSLIQILRKYGLLPPVAAGAVAASSNDQAQAKP